MRIQWTLIVKIYQKYNMIAYLQIDARISVIKLAIVYPHPYSTKIAKLSGNNFYIYLFILLNCVRKINLKNKKYLFAVGADSMFS